VIWNPEAEREAPAARAARQLERLRETVAWAVARVPFHAERLGAARLRRLDDLAALPFTRKSDLREHYPFGLFAVPRARACPHPRLVRHQGQADGGGLHRGRSRRLARGDGARDDGGRRAPR
jgi:hypothetical protein